MRNDCFGRRMSFSLKHRILLRDIDGAGLAQWAGLRTPNPRVPGSIPGSRKSFLGHFLVMSGSLFHDFWDVLGCVWEYCGDVFGWFWEGLGKKCGGGRKIKFFKKVQEYFFRIGLPLTIILRLFPEENIR